MHILNLWRGNLNTPELVLICAQVARWSHATYAKMRAPHFRAASSSSAASYSAGRWIHYSLLGMMSRIMAYDKL